jgi:hypothetical protein
MQHAKVHCFGKHTLYKDIHQRLRAVSRTKPEYAEVKAHQLHCILKGLPGYRGAVKGKNKHRVRWTLDTIARRLPHEFVWNYLPSGVMGAAILVRSSLNRHCTFVPHVTIDQLCVLVMELAPAIVAQSAI